MNIRAMLKRVRRVERKLYDGATLSDAEREVLAKWSSFLSRVGISSTRQERKQPKDRRTRPAKAAPLALGGQEDE